MNDAVPKDEDPRGPGAGELFIVRRDDERAPFGAQLQEQLAEIALPGGIERRRRLVHQQHRRIDGQRAGDGNPLRFAARELTRQRVGPMFDAERRQQLPAAPLGIRAKARRARGRAPDRRCSRQRDARTGSETGTPSPPAGEASGACPSRAACLPRASLRRARYGRRRTARARRSFAEWSSFRSPDGPMIATSSPRDTSNPTPARI